MTLQEQLRKLTTGGPGVTHIATETLFEDAANHIDKLEAALHQCVAELHNYHSIAGDEALDAAHDVLTQNSGEADVPHR
jgi:hypothetical protein